MRKIKTEKSPTRIKKDERKRKPKPEQEETKTVVSLLNCNLIGCSQTDSEFICCQDKPDWFPVNLKFPYNSYT